MIFGSEGMPRSGKSLDAMQHIVDSMQAGRTVVTNIYGVDHEAIGKYCAIPTPTIQRLLIVIAAPKDMDEDDIPAFIKAEFLSRQIPDCLWIWDEVNQFWPPERQPLPPQWARLITEHGQNGMDILLMGQDLSELHQTWRKRLQRYTRFTKLDMLGKEDSFHWSSWTNIGKNKYRQTADGKKPYKAEFFPLYKSHRDATLNKGNYADKRFGVFQAKHKVWAVIFGVVLCAALYNVVGFFQTPEAPPKETPSPASTAATPAPPVAAPPAPAPQQLPPDSTNVVEKAEPLPIDYLDKFATQYQPRLSAIIDREEPLPDKPAFFFQIDFLDDSYRLKERMSRADVSSLGWKIERKPYGILITKDDRSHVIRAWPLDNDSKVAQATVQSLKPTL